MIGYIKKYYISQADIIPKIGIVVLSIFFLISYMVLKFSILDLVKYIGFNLFYVFLPGFLIVKLLKLDIIDSVVEKIIYSFAFGVALTILLYFGCYLTKFRTGLYIIGPILSIVSLVLMAEKIKNYNLKIFKQVDYKLTCIICFILIISFVCVSFRNLPPEITGLSSIWQDLLWNIGNVDALKRDFPVYDARFAGLDFKYHYFVFIFRAGLGLITGISTEKIAFVYSQFVMIPFLVLSLYVFAETIFHNACKNRFFVWTFLFTGCASMIYLFKNTAGLFLNVTILDLVILPNGIDLGIPIFLLLMSFLIKIYRNNKACTNEIIAVGILSALLTGAKGPFGIMIVSTVFVIFIISLIKKDNIILNFKLILSMTLAFIIVYFFTMAGAGGEPLKIMPGSIILNSKLGDIIKKLVLILNLKNASDVQYFLANIITPVHFFLFLPFTSVPFICWIILKAKKFKVIKKEELLIGGVAISGIMGFYLFAVDGNSQLYFIFGATAFIEMGAFIWLYDHYNNLNRYFKFFIIMLFVISSISSFSMFARNSLDGFSVAYQAITNVKYEAEPAINAVTKYEYEGMLWLKNNVKDNEIIAVDRHYNSKPQVKHIPSPNDESRYFYYSAYSGKQIFLEGWAYTSRNNAMQKKIVERFQINEELYLPINKDRVNLMNENNISYIVVSTFIHPGLVFDDLQLKKVFANKDITIYQLIN